MTDSVAMVAVGPRVHDLSTPVAQGVAHHLGCTVTACTRQIDPERFFASQRGQYWSTPILAELESHRPATAARVLGLTGGDLFVPVLTFVFGEAHLGGTAALVSSHRLDPTVYGLGADRERLEQRAVKEAVHELGHTYGLRHCRDYACVMRASRVVEEVDEKAAGFCADCAGQLASVGLDSVARRP